ncbi:MAG TPA: polysaccharide biosynthesis/export family protein [Thermohalobaculum sp.]|nr:polysaccharide biosynthesis/export family protein [Thermohalobaculum sp.]
MIPLERLARLSLLAVTMLGVAACGLPRSGPYYEEITAEATPELDYDVVAVTAAVTRDTRVDERLGFAETFRGAPAVDTAAIAVGDVLSVTVWENIEQGLLNPQGIGATQLPRAKVDREGFIFVPYIGPVRAAGHTVASLREAIQRRLSEKTLNPQVDVFAEEGRGRMVSVQGRVRTPGLYPIETETERLLPMLARAGGVTEEPEVVRLRLRRGARTGEIWVQDLYDEPANNVAMHDGDALIAERDRRIFTALGAVGQPSTVPFPVRELSVEQAMGTVGGLTEGSADPTGVFVFREERPEIVAKVLPGEAGTGPRRVVYLLNLTEPGGMFLAREFIMRDGDTLYVTTAPFTRWMKVVQSIAPLVTFTGAAKSLVLL